MGQEQGTAEMTHWEKPPAIGVLAMP
jgi:hypothetical protein